MGKEIVKCICKERCSSVDVRGSKYKSCSNLAKVFVFTEEGVLNSRYCEEHAYGLSETGQFIYLGIETLLDEEFVFALGRGSISGRILVFVPDKITFDDLYEIVNDLKTIIKNEIEPYRLMIRISGGPPIFEDVRDAFFKEVK